MNLPIPTPLDAINCDAAAAWGINLWIKREDLLHPQLSGNKWHKLQLNLEYAVNQAYRGLVSFGGAYSNHLHALAWAGQHYGLNTVGLVRGELKSPLNATLEDCKNWGMQLVPVSREQYRHRNAADLLQAVATQYPGYMVIPEGGANQLAISGCARWGEEILRQLPQMDFLCVPCGTGATLAGLVAGLSAPIKVLGFPAVKGDTDMPRRIEGWLAQRKTVASWALVERFHFGGFAKFNSALVSFMDRWQRDTGISVEPVYTAKLIFGVMALVEEGYFPAGSNVVVVHSGGMQGIRGLQARIKRLR